MTEGKKKPSRKRNKLLPVPVLPSEDLEIKRNAKACGLSTAAFLRGLGLRHRPKSIMDSNSVLELAKVNGDLGRLGGLLKMLLTNDERLKAIGKEQAIPSINELLDEIKNTQAILLNKAQQI